MTESLDQPAAADRSTVEPPAAPVSSAAPAASADAPGTDVKGPSTGAQFLTVFPPIMLPMFMAVADQTIVATALPAIASSLGEIERASWVVVSYLIANTIAAPVYGRLGDTFGRRLMMVLALALFMVGSVLCALAPNIELLTAFRVLQGFGGGGLMTLSQALIGEAIPPRERGRYQGYLAGIAVSSNTFGPVAGGYLTQAFGWQSIFLINIPLGLLAMLFVFRIPPRQGDRRRTTFDAPGLVLFIFFVGPVILALEQVQRMQLSAMPMALAMLAVGLISLGLLTWQERLTAAPLIPPKLFRQPSIWRADAMAALHGGALVSLITFLPIYLRAARGASPGETGLILLPLTAGIGIGSMITGQMVTRTGYTAVFPTFGLLGATAGLHFHRFVDPASVDHGNGLGILHHCAVHGHDYGSRPGDGAGGIRSAPPRNRRGHGAVLPLGGCRFRHRYGRRNPVFDPDGKGSRDGRAVRHNYRAGTGSARNARSGATSDRACRNRRRFPCCFSDHRRFHRLRLLACLVAAAAPALIGRA